MKKHVYETLDQVSTKSFDSRVILDWELNCWVDYDFRKNTISYYSPKWNLTIDIHRLVAFGIYLQNIDFTMKNFEAIAEHIYKYECDFDTKRKSVFKLKD